MKLKKTLRIFGIIILLLILTVVVLFNLYGTKAIKIGIEKGATTALKVPVAVDGVNLSILSGKAGIKGLVIDNPKGYENRKLLEMGNAQVGLQIRSALSDTIIIDQVLMEDVMVSMEQKGLTNNIQEILDNLPKSDKPAAKPKPEPKEDTDESQKNLKIKKLELTGIVVMVKLIPLPGKADTVTLKLSPIIMTDLGSEEKLDIAVLASKILVAIADGIVKEGAGILPEDMLNSLGDVTGELLKGATGVLEATGDAILKGDTEKAEKAIKDIENIGNDISKGLGGLLKTEEKKE
ncbi:MAG: hypothetical protein GY799_12530 [Desulfobulbaceae bacterium]|nr:hypothetical protein [Desulfobulbaceae bacterium]